MPVRQTESIGQVEHNHSEQGDREEHGKAGCEEEGHPGLDQHMGVVVMDVKLLARVKILVALQRLLTRVLRGYLPTATPLIERAQGKAESPQTEHLNWRENGVDDEHRGDLAPDVRVPSLVEVVVDTYEIIFEDWDFNIHWC